MTRGLRAETEGARVMDQVKYLKCWAALLVATHLSCRSAVEPPLTLPDSVFSSLCTTFVQGESYDSSTSTLVLRKTRPVFNTFALRLLQGEGKLTPANAENLVSSPGERQVFEQAIRIGSQDVKVRVVVNAHGELRSVFINRRK